MSDRQKTVEYERGRYYNIQIDDTDKTEHLIVVNGYHRVLCYQPNLGSSVPPLLSRLA
jgi:hypothetical protein